MSYACIALPTQMPHLMRVYLLQDHTPWHFVISDGSICTSFMLQIIALKCLQASGSQWKTPLESLHVPMWRQ